MLGDGTEIVLMMAVIVCNDDTNDMHVMIDYRLEQKHLNESVVYYHSRQPFFWQMTNTP